MSASALSGFSGLHRSLVAHSECSSDGGPGVPSLTSLGDEFGAASGHAVHPLLESGERREDVVVCHGQTVIGVADAGQLCNHGCMTGAATSRPIGDPIIFQSTRPAAWPAPEGTTVTVTARKSRNGSIGITWQRSDIDTPTTVAVTSEEFAGISAAVSVPSESSAQGGTK